MAQTTAIEWTDVSWNPVHGCSKVSPGCAHCYAETLSLRYRQTTKPWTPENAAENVILKPHKLREPLSKAKPWNKPCRVFVNSMSDLFHELVPDDYIDQVFDVMAQAPQHTFQVLTKRPERMRDYAQWLGTPLPNVWLGTSIENRRFVGRADALRETPAAVRFVSAEPLLGPLTTATCICCRGPLGHYDLCFECANNLCPDCGFDEETLEPVGYNPRPYENYPPGRLSLQGIDWLIVGGESGAGHRRIDAQWVRDLRDAARASGTAFFFKQWGGSTSKAGGRTLDGRIWSDMPVRSSGFVPANEGEKTEPVAAASAPTRPPDPAGGETARFTTEEP